MIEQRFSECTLTQTAIASELGVTPQALSVMFKQHTGLTFTDYLRRTRLNRAAHLLATGDLRVKEVWVAAGYNDASNFDHQFKAHFGVTPRAYRASALSPCLSPDRGPAARTAKGTRMRSADPTGAASLLIVDDNASTRESIVRYFRLCGYDVSEAACGVDGLEDVRERSPRVVLLDYNLPDMDGIEWIRSLRAARQDSDPPILLFTADWEVAGRADELRALGTTFVSKLCDIEDLERQIAALCRSH